MATDERHDPGPRLDRRAFFGRAGTLASAFAISPAVLRAAAAAGRTPLDFAPVAASTADELTLPASYRAQVLIPWGTPLGGGGAPFDPAAGADDQRKQSGMHHDGMAFFPIGGRSDHGYLAVNHEYTDEGLLHPGGTAGWNAAKVAKSKAAVGVSIVEIRRDGDTWKVAGGRRVTGLDEIEIRGPARGHALMKTDGDASTPAERAGTGVTGTMGNCANGQTPWGTYLTCEENVQDYFARTPGNAGDLEAHMQRYGIGAPWITVDGWRSRYGWDAADPRFDLDRAEYRNHSHRFGWVVEIDPLDPARRPAKRTALGRFRHENAATIVAPDGRVVVYMGDDARFEYIYKFVSSRRYEPELEGDSDAERARKRDHNWTLLDDGKLYAAVFESGHVGRWVQLSRKHPDLGDGFGSHAEVVMFARRAADLAGASKMDRPEWIAVDQDPATRRVRHAYVSLTNNTQRGTAGKEGTNPANPRTNNVYGHIVRWRETGGDPTATTFTWRTFVTCGWRGHDDLWHRGDITGAPGARDQDYGSPDGLWLDPRGILWVQTDASVSMIDGPDYAPLGNNQMLAVDKVTGETRRFLVGPKGCEITGIVMTPDFKTMFVNVQHPGETPSGFSDPARPLAVSGWPNGDADGRPRSATVVITHRDGKAIGAR